MPTINFLDSSAPGGGIYTGSAPNADDGETLRDWATITNTNMEAISVYLEAGGVILQTSNNLPPDDSLGEDGDLCVDFGNAVLWIKGRETATEWDNVNDRLDLGGAAGSDGEDGVGVPALGTTNQGLLKTSDDADASDTAWGYVALASEVLTIDVTSATNGEGFKWDATAKELVPEALLEFVLSGGSPYATGQFPFGNGTAFANTTLEMDLIQDLDVTTNAPLATDMVMAYDSTLFSGSGGWQARAQLANTSTTSTRKFVATNTIDHSVLSSGFTALKWGAWTATNIEFEGAVDIADPDGDGSHDLGFIMKVAGDYTFTVHIGWKTLDSASDTETQGSVARMIFYTGTTAATWTDLATDWTVHVDTQSYAAVHPTTTGVAPNDVQMTRNSCSMSFVKTMAANEKFRVDVRRESGGDPTIQVPDGFAKILIEA